MRRALLFVLGLGLLALAGHGFDAVGQIPDAPEQKFGNFERLVKGAKEYDGLFKLHQKDDHLYAEIPQHQFEKPMLCPIAIARGMGMGGYTLNFDEQWVLYFKRVGDKVQLVRRNVHFRAKSGSPLAKAVETTYTDSVLLALRIQAINQQRNAVVIDLNDIFMSDFAQLGIGHFDSNRSTWHKIKAFPQNIELEVAATYAGGGGRMFRYGGDDSVIDPRGTTVVIHYGLSLLPDGGYQPRFADDRVGHFLSVVKDFSSDNRDTSFLRYVNRWRLERAENDSKNKDKLSAPKKKIVFWIEKSVPDEYRAYVREGILEWNKAFEKIGFRDAIEVRQQESEDFDPEDINYNTFRWITTDGGFAMGPSRVNPLTGEILDADIIFDASMVRFWKHEQATLLPNGQLAEEPASLIQATRMGWGPAEQRLASFLSLGQGWNEPRQSEAPDAEARMRLRAARLGICQCCNQMKYELGLAAMAMADSGVLKPGEKVPEELIGQAIKEVTMHEVGHTLGLRHNFKASTMLKNEQLHDTNITRKQGLVGSVMDYAPVNLAPKGVKQGDYFSTTIGPYDYWAIEYAYKPLSGGTEGELEELQKISTKCATPGLDYATDEDLRGTADPLVNVWDLGADPMKFGQDRMLLAEELLKTLAERAVDKGEGYQRTRVAFGMLLGQYGNAAHLISLNIGGEHMHRDHAGDPNGRDPFIPVKTAKQREALKFLQEHILSDRAFQFSPQLLRRLAADRWLHWGNDGAAIGGVDYPVNQRVLNIQRIVLNHMVDPGVLTRIQNNALKADKEEQPLTMAEVFRSVSDGVWSDLPAPNKPDPKVTSSVIRRNLQREHLKGLSELVLGKKASGGGFFFSFGSSRPVPPDARSLARLHLREIQRRINAVIGDEKVKGVDDTTRAHLEECQDRIAKVLNAAMQVNE
jgi:hypothetical protein